MAKLVRLRDITDSLDVGFTEGYKQGLTTHVKSFDKHFRWMTGHVVIFAGMPNYGKSTILNQLLLLRAIKEDQKFAFWTPEFAPTDFFYLDLIHAYVGKSPYKQHKYNKMTRDEFEIGKKFIDEHFFYYKPEKGGDSMEKVNEALREAVLEFGCKTVVTDPFNKIRGMEEGKKRDDHLLATFFNEETDFAQDLDVTKIVVMHTNASVTKEDDGNFSTPDIFNIAGGAMTGNRVEDIVIIHRPYGRKEPANPISRFESIKIKKQFLCGYRGGVNFQLDTMRNRIVDIINEGDDDSPNYVTYDPFNGYEKWIPFEVDGNTVENDESFREKELDELPF